jgi:hypothetical protein
MLRKLLAWLRAQTSWSFWVGNFNDEAVMRVYILIDCFGYRVDLHRIVKADKLGCFHSHPATAYRFVLWGGYAEEVWVSPHLSYTHGIPAGFWGRVTPDYIHRIEYLPSGSSWSLWFRGRVVAPIRLVGNGWPAALQRARVNEVG